MVVMAARRAMVAVVDHRHPLLALPQTLVQGKTTTKEMPDQGRPIRDSPCCVYVEVSDGLLCMDFVVECCG